jgi:signal transduction histidine kinase
VQIFRNILENALAACNDPVEIHIECAGAELVQSGGGQRSLRISIRDNGPGLSPEQRRRIFEPFFTTKPKGTGLGMAIVQQLVEAHGGAVEVGTPEHGAEIVITLPEGIPQ